MKSPATIPIEAEKIANGRTSSDARIVTPNRMAANMIEKRHCTTNWWTRVRVGTLSKLRSCAQRRTKIRKGIARIALRITRQIKIKVNLPGDQSNGDERDAIKGAAFTTSRVKKRDAAEFPRFALAGKMAIGRWVTQERGPELRAGLLGAFDAFFGGAIDYEFSAAASNCRITGSNASGTVITV